MTPAQALLARPGRWKPAELAFWLAAVAALLVFRAHAALYADICITALFALSLDLILGYAGILSLGHAAFLGLGAYVAGVAAAHGLGEPVLGLAMGGLAAGALGFASSFLLLRGADLTRLMLTLGIGQLLAELANRLPWITGGSDGLQNMDVKPILGLVEFDLAGHVGAVYSLVVLFLCFLVARRLMAAPFGWSLRAIRGNALRAGAIGIPVRARLVAVYTLAAVLAGIAGAELAETTQFVSLDVLAFHRSADVMLVLVIGGVGYLYGGLVGAVLFKLVQDLLSGITPQYWEFWIGLVLVAMVLAGRERIGARMARLVRRAA